MRLIDRLHATSSPIRAFVTSSIIGTLVAASPVLPFAIVLAIYALSDLTEAPGSIFLALLLVITPIVVAFPVVLLGSAIFGIPVFLFLRRMENETMEIYMISGAFLGFMVPIFVLAAARAETGYLLFCIAGAASGSATAWSWARYRLRSKGR